MGLVAFIIATQSTNQSDYHLHLRIFLLESLILMLKIAAVL